MFGTPGTSIVGAPPAPELAQAQAVAAVQRPPVPGITPAGAPAAPAGDSDSRHTGVVAFYSKLRGYGFITPSEPGVAPDDRLFVHWRNIQSEDRFPFLVKGMEVEFGVMKWRGVGRNGQAALRAKTVTLPGGANVCVQDELDAQKKTFVGPQDSRYTGVLKFYNARAGYGYITVDSQFVGQGEEGNQVPTEVRVERAEVNAGGKQAQWMQNLSVEFGIWKTARGDCKAYNVTLPGGRAMTQAALENRQAVGAQTFRGEVTVWNWRQGWGFIKPDSAVPLPPNVQAKLTQQTQAAAEKATARGKTASNEELLYFRRQDVKMGTQLQRNTQVMFSLYVDDKGAGAYEVQLI